MLDQSRGPTGSGEGDKRKDDDRDERGEEENSE
jgi:hypothetical protein